MKHFKEVNGKLVCNKKPYLTEREAVGALKYLQLTMNDPQKKTHYRCRFCSCWHLTSHNKKSSRRVKEHYDNTLNKKNQAKRKQEPKSTEPKPARKRNKKSRQRNTIIGEQLKKLLNKDNDE